MSWKEILSEYPDQLRLAVYEAAIHYAETGEVANLSDAEARMALSFIRRDIDRNIAKRRRTSEGRSAAGRRGNETRWEKNKSQTIANIANATFATNKSQTSLNENDNDNENENENERKKNVAIATSKESAAIAALSTANADDAASSAERPNVDEGKFIDVWNSARAKNNAIVPPVQTIRGRRLTMLKARIKDYGEQWVVEVFGRAAASQFLNGGGSQGFVANIDWVLKPNNFVKVMEGNYDSHRGTAGSGYNVGTTQIDNSTDKWEGEEEKWR